MAVTAIQIEGEFGQVEHRHQKGADGEEDYAKDSQADVVQVGAYLVWQETEVGLDGWLAVVGERFAGYGVERVV